MRAVIPANPLQGQNPGWRNPHRPKTRCRPRRVRGKCHGLRHRTSRSPVFANGAAYAAFSYAVASSAQSSKQDALYEGDGDGGVTEDQLERARAVGLKRLDKLRARVADAQSGNKGALKFVNKYFGADAASNLAGLDQNLANIANELGTAGFAVADESYIAARAAQGDTVGMYVDSAHPGKIYYNPNLSGSTSSFAALATHEAAHLAGYSHQRFLGSVVYGSSASIKFAGSAGWAGASRNPSNYSCAAFSGYSNC